MPLSDTGATLAELEDDPHPLLARLRAREPVAWVPAVGGWLVTSHAMAVRVMRDAAAFTVDDPRFSTARVLGPSMLSLDGRAHARHREPFARPFRPAETRARFTAFVEAEVDRIVTGLAPAGHAELRGELAGPLAVAVVAQALGLDGADATTIRAWYGAFVDAVSAITAGDEPPARAAAAHERLRTSVQRVIDAPGTDSRSLLAVAARDEEGLSAAEVVANAAVLMFGGIDTTEGMIANAVMHLLRHPEQADLVRDDRDGLLPGAIEESLAGANRDPAVFPDPDRFDVRRENAADHLAFAHGPHFCFGAHLARLETRTVLEALLTRLPGLRLDPSRPARARGLVFRKPPSLHVLWDSLP
jgi:cytochrome P450